MVTIYRLRGVEYRIEGNREMLAFMREARELYNSVAHDFYSGLDQPGLGKPSKATAPPGPFITKKPEACS